MKIDIKRRVGTTVKKVTGYDHKGVVVGDKLVVVGSANVGTLLRFKDRCGLHPTRFFKRVYRC